MPKLGHTIVSQLRRYSAPGPLRSRLFIAYIAGLLLLFLLITALSNNVNLARVQQEKAQWWRVHTLDVLLTEEQIDTALNKVLRGVDFIRPDDQGVVHAAHVVIITGQRAAVDLPPSEWSIDYHSLDFEGECLAPQTAATLFRSSPITGPTGHVQYVVTTFQPRNCLRR